ncbi:MAG TPA: type II toxin-antitoxin system PemK/MazF family toxin [Candidatus Limnocylindrales bacterium]
MAERPHPKRGEVWWVKPGKTAGAELQKKRPYVVISADAIGNVPIKIVVPFKTWQDRFADWPWVVRIEPTRVNGLKRTEAADVMHVKSLDTSKFIELQGRLSAAEMDDITAALAIVVEYE